MTSRRTFGTRCRRSDGQGLRRVRPPASVRAADARCARWLHRIRWYATALGAVPVGFICAEPSAFAQAAPGPAEVETIHLTVGQAHLIQQGKVRRIVVGSGRVIQVTALDKGQILVIPEQPGQSSLHLWGRTGLERALTVVVTERDVGRVSSEVRGLLADSATVRSRPVGDKVVLESDHPTENDVERIAEIQKRYPQVVNLVSRAGYERMVQMEVRMIEIGRNALERLGVQWQSRTGAPFAAEGPTFGLIGDIGRSAAFREGGVAAAEGFGVRAGVAPFGAVASIASSLTSVIDLLVQSGDAAVLAEPRLSCRSGGTARFVAGGELPIPVVAPNGSASVQFKEYGVRFEVSPVVAQSGMIAATLQAEISSINPEVRVRDVPGLRKQSASTQVNLAQGQTLVIAGMISSEFSGSVDKIPALGDLPILGRLFRSRRFQDRETEMIVLITPTLQDPARPREDARALETEARLDQVRQKLRMLD